MKKKVKVIIGMFVSMVAISFPASSYANDNNENKTSAGIEFQQNSDSSTTDKKTEPLTPNKPTTKRTGTLPKTGELLQPIIFLLLGCLLIIILASFYLILHKDADDEEDFS